jgi:hypothetical protein
MKYLLAKKRFEQDQKGLVEENEGMIEFRVDRADIA